MAAFVIYPRLAVWSFKSVPPIDEYECICSRRILKTVWQKDKLQICCRCVKMRLFVGKSWDLIYELPGVEDWSITGGVRSVAIGVTENREHVNAFPHIQQICSRRLLKHQNVAKCGKTVLIKIYLWHIVENIVSKWEIARFEQFLLLSHTVFKSRLLQRRQKAFIWGKHFNTCRRDFRHPDKTFKSIVAENEKNIFLLLQCYQLYSIINYHFQRFSLYCPGCFKIVCCI